MAKKKSEGEKEGSWMDTYGDMVTLLLTFFVMLYATSSIDEGKWQMILQAFTNKGEVINPVVAPLNPSDSEKPYNDDSLEEGEYPQSFDQLYQYLVKYIEENNLTQSVQIEKNNTNIYIKFTDKIFFNGDSDVLLDTGKQVLDGMSKGIHAVDDKILAIKVCGHTAEGQYSKVNNFELSVGRASNVVNYMIDINTSDPQKFIPVGYGKYRPIAPNDSETNRMLNRRVEIIIIRNDVDFSDQDVIDELMGMEYGMEYTNSDELPKHSEESDKTHETEQTQIDQTEVN